MNEKVSFGTNIRKNVVNVVNVTRIVVKRILLNKNVVKRILFYAGMFKINANFENTKFNSYGKSINKKRKKFFERA